MINNNNTPVTPINNNFKKLTLAQARKAWNNNENIYLVSSKIYPSYNNPWITPYKLNKETSEIKDLQVLINNFSYYNCNKELGLRVNYYISEEIQIDIKIVE